MKDFFTNPNAFEEYLTSSSPMPEVRPYAQDESFHQYWVERLQRDGFVGAQNYYIATRNNIQSAADAQLPPENSKIKVPHLYVGTDQDAVCRPEMLDVSRPLLTDLTEVPIVHAAHWSPYEAPKEMATPIREWLLKKFLDKQ